MARRIAVRLKVTRRAQMARGSILADLFTNVSVMDASGLDSYLTFVHGIGDVAITYENQYFAGAAAGDAFTIVYPARPS